jgi:hypothetical protein
MQSTLPVYRFGLAVNGSSRTETFIDFHFIQDSSAIRFDYQILIDPHNSCGRGPVFRKGDGEVLWKWKFCGRLQLICVCRLAMCKYNQYIWCLFLYWGKIGKSIRNSKSVLILPSETSSRKSQVALLIFLPTNPCSWSIFCGHFSWAKCKIVLWLQFRHLFRHAHVTSMR